jgi:hypothetical protein
MKLRRVVGVELVSTVEDLFNEVSLLLDIWREYRADTAAQGRSTAILYVIFSQHCRGHEAEAAGAPCTARPPQAGDCVLCRQHPAVPGAGCCVWPFSDVSDFTVRREAISPREKEIIQYAVAGGLVFGESLAMRMPTRRSSCGGGGVLVLLLQLFCDIVRRDRRHASSPAPHVEVWHSLVHLCQYRSLMMFPFCVCACLCQPSACLTAVLHSARSGKVVPLRPASSASDRTHSRASTASSSAAKVVFSVPHTSFLALFGAEFSFFISSSKSTPRRLGLTGL